MRCFCGMVNNTHPQIYLDAHGGFFNSCFPADYLDYEFGFVMEEIEVFCTNSSSTGENVKLFLDDDLLSLERAPSVVINSGEYQYDSLELEDIENTSGQEVQRISVINNLPDLLRDTESHDECMRRVVPKVREVLHVAQTEMQLAASSAFLQILQKNLVPIQNYSQTFLQTILNSVDSKDPDVANAWLDTLLDVIDLLPKDVIRKEILSVAVAKGQLSQSVQARMACCKILGKVSTKFEPFVIKKEILPVVQSLCQDVDYEVRGCMCRQLDSVSRGLGLEATKSAILPELVELTNDEESYVRIAGLETVVNILSLLDTETCCSTIIPLVCKICQQALQSEDATLPVVSKQFGKLCHGLSEHLTDEQKQWFVDFYKKLCKVGLAADRNKDTDLPDLFELEDKLIESRKNGAFNFPAMVLFTGAKQFKSELLGTFSSLCKDPHIMVRKTVSSGYHEVCKLLGNSIQLLQPDLILLLKDDSIEVLRGVISNIPVIIDCHLGGGSNHAISEAKSNSLSDVIPALLASEAVIFSSNNWRLQQELMENMSCLLRCCSSETLYQKVIPLLFQKIKAARALPVKLAASKSAILISRKLKKLEQREELFHQLVTDFCHARSCYQRGLFIDICKIVIDVYSKKFFKEHYFEYVLELHTDSVPNIRLRLCSILPELKRLLKLPTDRSLLQQLDMCIRKLLVAEKDRDVQNAVKAAVDELDKIHIQMESLTRRNFFEQDMADQKKEEEERVMIENEEKEAKKEEEQAEKKSKGDKRNAASAKKGENGSSKIPAPRKGSKAGVAGGSSGSSNQTSSKIKETTVSRSSSESVANSNNKMVKSKSTNTLSLIPRRDENTKITEAKLKTKLPKATHKASQGQSSGIKSPSVKTNTIKMAGDKPSSPKLSRLPLYSSQPNLHNGRPTSPSLIPVKATTSSINKSGTGKTATRAGGPAAPGSAGTRRGSNPSIPAQRRGSLTTASSSTSEASSVKSTKGSNGSLPPSSKSRKKSK